MADTKTSVVIKYAKPGAAPPIYLAGSFPDSVWQPQEMEYTNDSNDDYVFSKAVEVEEGKEYQYKFRIGNGDWWMSDEDAPIVTDDIGNRNNLLKVPIKPSSQVKSVSDEKSPEENSTPRTIPTSDTEEKMEAPIESILHTKSGDKASESSPPEVSTIATGSISNKAAEAKSEQAEQTHDTAPLIAEASHAAEQEKETSTKELDLSHIPVQELEVSGSKVDESDHLESHTDQKANEGLKTTTEISDSKPALATQEAGEISEKALSNKSDATEPEEVSTKYTDELTHPVTSTDKDGVIEEAELVPTPPDESNLEEESASAEAETKEETDSKKDEISGHQKELISTLVDPEQAPTSENAKKEETDTNEVGSQEHHAEPALVDTEVLESKQEPHTSKTDEEPITPLTKDPILDQESVTDESEAKEEISEVKAASEHKESFNATNEEPILTREPHVSKSEIEEPFIAHVKEPLASEGEGETKEEPVSTFIKEPTSVEEPLISDYESQEKTDAADDHATAESQAAEELDTNKSQDSELLTSGTTRTNQGNKDLTEEANEEVPGSFEASQSNSGLSTESIKSDAKETSSAEQVVVEEIEATPKEEQMILESLEVEEPKEVAASKVEESNEPPEIVSTPLLVVEKVDSEPRLGDDFGSDATYAQKEAHSLDAQDAVPDQVTIRQQASTPDLANVAAEVADSAALLDETPPTPPMSDKEAGKIGYRRLSQTPIPEVAETAAEVADTAALIDENSKPTSIDLPTPQREFFARRLDGLDRDLDVETPFDERAPLFAHESNGPPTAEERLEYESAQSQIAVPEPLFREFDPNDPSLEPFPSNFNQILEHVRRLENQLSEDQTEVERSANSPVTMNGGLRAEGADLSTPSPRSLVQESSPSLLPIVEEHVESELGPKLTVLPPSIDKSQSDGNTSPEPKMESGEDGTKFNDGENLDSGSQDSAQPPTIKAPRSSSPQTSSVRLASNLHKLHPVLPDLPQTPFAENKALNLEGNVSTSPTEPDPNSPSITVQPATPAASLNAKINESVPEEGAAKTTSFAEENKESQLRARKQPANAPERSITPASMHSAGNDANNRNFLRAFFHVVFVDWIGGLFRKLCGGGRHT